MSTSLFIGTQQLAMPAKRRFNIQLAITYLALKVSTRRRDRTQPLPSECYDVVQAAVKKSKTTGKKQLVMKSISGLEAIHQPPLFKETEPEMRAYRTINKRFKMLVSNILEKVKDISVLELLQCLHGVQDHTLTLNNFLMK